MIVNPGSTHFDDVLPEDTPAHPVLIDMNDYPNAATTVASLNNNPVAVLDDDA